MFCNIFIELGQALCGFQINHLGIDGKELAIKIDDIVNLSCDQRIIGEGMPKKNGGRGDLIFNFHLISSDSLSPSQKMLLFQENISF